MQKSERKAHFMSCPSQSSRRRRPTLTAVQLLVSRHDFAFHSRSFFFLYLKKERFISLFLTRTLYTVDCPCHGRHISATLENNVATFQLTVCTGCCCDVLSDFLRLLLFRWNFQTRYTTISLQHMSKVIQGH